MAKTRTIVSLSAQLAVLLLIATAFFMRTSPVDGLSMEPRVHAGELVLINTLAYRLGEIGRGLVGYDVAHAQRIMGRSSRDIEAILGFAGRATLIHRDDMALSSEG